LKKYSREYINLVYVIPVKLALGHDWVLGLTKIDSRFPVCPRMSYLRGTKWRSNL